jgi:hypothetical protein
MIPERLPRTKQTTSRNCGVDVVILLVSAWMAVGNSPLDVRAQDSNKPTESSESSESADFAKVLEDLGSSNYAVREYATQRIRRLGGEPLRKTIDRLESTEGETFQRLLGIVSEIAVSERSEESRFAFERLTRLSQGMNGGRSIQVKQIVESICLERGRQAWRRYKRNSTNMQTRFPTRSQKEMDFLSPLVIDSTFSGTADDLEGLDQVRWVNFARLSGPKITREYLEAVLKLPNLSHLQIVNANLTTADLMLIKDGPDLNVLELQYVPIDDQLIDRLVEFPIWEEIWIYGTKSSRAAVERAESRLGDVKLTYSRGAFLGVSCQRDSALVDSVERDSAAEKCGLMRGDVILSINNRSIKRFEELRQELSFFADGEEVEIEFLRKSPTEIIKTKVQLGRRGG